MRHIAQLARGLVSIAAMFATLGGLMLFGGLFIYGFPYSLVVIILILAYFIGEED